jgi:hypothetical protein
MFRVVLSPIIRSAYNCIYSIWYLSHRYCYLPLSWIYIGILLGAHPILHISRMRVKILSYHHKQTNMQCTTVPLSGYAPSHIHSWLTVTYCWMQRIRIASTRQRPFLTPHPDGPNLSAQMIAVTVAECEETILDECWAVSLLKVRRHFATL